MVETKNGSMVSMRHGKVRVMEFLELYSFTTKSTITVSKAKTLEDLHEIFQLPLSNEAFHYYDKAL
jgi:hypothetical protein